MVMRYASAGGQGLGICPGGYPVGRCSLSGRPGRLRCWLVAVQPARGRRASPWVRGATPGPSAGPGGRNVIRLERSRVDVEAEVRGAADGQEWLVVAGHAD